MKKKVSLYLVLLTVFILCIINICVIKAEESSTQADSETKTETYEETKTSRSSKNTKASTKATSAATEQETSTSVSETKETESVKSTESASETTSGTEKSSKESTTVEIITSTTESDANSSTDVSTKATESATEKSTSSYWSGYTNLTTPSGEDTKLASLTVKNYSLSPSFAPNVVDYTLKVEKDVKSVIISAIPNDKTSDWRIVGYGKAENNQIKVDLVTGKNIVKVVCTSGAGYSKTYRITITREGVVEKTSSHYEEQSDNLDNVIISPGSKIKWKLVLPLVLLEVAILACIAFIFYKKRR